MVLGRNMSTTPAIMKMTSRAQRAPGRGWVRLESVPTGDLKKNVEPPQAVKSILVWKANTVRAKVTPAVMPTWGASLIGHSKGRDD